MKIAHHRGLFVALGFLALAGCATTTTQSGSDTTSDLTAAVRLVDSGNHHAAVPRLEAIIGLNPQSAVALEAHYHLGRAYEGVGAVTDAMSHYAAYVQRDPTGRYVQDATSSLAELRALQDERMDDTDALWAEIEALRAKVSRNPNDITVQLTLADRLWRVGEYESARALYEQLHRQDPSVANDAGFRARIEIDSNGRYIALTPQEQTRRSVVRAPVAVINTSAFKANRERYTQRPRWYVVSGQVENRTDGPVSDVVVRVAIYGYGSTIYDVRTERLGGLGPGEIRGFSARFTQFEDINSIDRYECSVTFR